jgi:hypothetical protein
VILKKVLQDFATSEQSLYKVLEIADLLEIKSIEREREREREALL